MKIVVIGYGNTLRRDDGAGPRLVEALRALALPDVDCIIRHQLTPELAHPVSSADAAIFVDASAEAERRIEFVNAQPAEVFTHATEPGAVLGLARALYGSCPPGWRLHVPAHDFGLGEEFSPETQRHFAPALQELQAFIERIRSQKGSPVCTKSI